MPNPEVGTVFVSPKFELPKSDIIFLLVGKPTTQVDSVTRSFLKLHKVPSPEMDLSLWGRLENERCRNKGTSTLLYCHRTVWSSTKAGTVSRLHRQRMDGIAFISQQQVLKSQRGVKPTVKLSAMEFVHVQCIVLLNILVHMGL